MPGYTGSRGTDGGGSTGVRAPIDPRPAQSDKPASDANTAIDDCSSTGNPVIIATGEKFKHEPDFGAGGNDGLELRRTYRSFDTKAKMFGSRWLSSYDYTSLQTSGCFYNPDYPGVCIPTSIVFRLPDGASYTYPRSAGGDLSFKVKNSQAMGTLYYEGSSGWTLNKDQKTYTFSAAGLIQRIQTVGGTLLLQFTYVGLSTRPSRVANGAGQAIDFTLVSNRVVKARGPAGNEWNYAYDTNGMLASVSSPGA